MIIQRGLAWVWTCALGLLLLPVWSQPSNVSPPDLSIDVAPTVDLEVSFTNAVTNATFYIRPKAEPGEDFIFMVLPDTQRYADNNIGEFEPSFFKDQVDWIVANHAVSNIAYVSHVGDIVQNYDTGNTNEWLHAANAMYRLEDPVTTGLAEGIPYGILAGNHDVTGTNCVFFNQLFGSAHFAGKSYYGASQNPADNHNYYNTFEAGGMQFLHFNIIWLADMAVVGPWMNTVADAHPDHLIIVTSHHVCGKNNPSTFSGTGQEIYDTLKDNPNFFFLTGGHAIGEGQRSDTNKNNVVTTILSNYQGLPNGGNGWLRYYKFSPSNDTIQAYTYSPVLDGFMDGPSSEFMIGKAFRHWFAPWQTVSTFANLPAGNVIATASALELGSNYEWYVEADCIKGPVWSFETKENEPPVLQAVSDLTINEGDVVSLPLSATDPNAGQTLAWTILQAPSSATISPATGATTVFSWVSTELDGPGTYTVEIVVADDATLPGSDSVTFTITVNEINQAPQLTLVPTNACMFVDVGVPINLQAVGTDADTPANTLFYAMVSGQPQGMQMNILTGQITWTPTAAQASQLFPLKVQVGDNGTPPLIVMDEIDLIVTVNGTLAMRPAIKRLAVNQVDVRWPTFPGYSYELQTSPSMLTPAWQTLGTFDANGPELNWMDTSSADRGFYRVRLLGK